MANPVLVRKPKIEKPDRHMISREITRRSSTNFAWAFWGLSKRQRTALHALYAFCRTIDDVVDESPEPAQAARELTHWREILSRLKNPSVFDPPVARELSQACRDFPIRLEDLQWILQGVEDDLQKTRYQSFEELLSYCDAVASAVGLASMAIFGGDRDRTQAYTFATGRALQLTNILRDVGADAHLGRIYVPLQDLESFQCREKDILRGRYSEAYRSLMGFQVHRARRFYREAEASLSAQERKRFPAAEVMRKTYGALLRRIEFKEFRVFEERVRVSRPRKLAIAFSVWAPHFFRSP